MAFKKGQLVHITWYDAEVSNEWTDEDSKTLDDHSTTICESVGYLVRSPTKKDPMFVIASTRSKDDDGKLEYNAITKIPKGMVKEVSS